MMTRATKLYIATLPLLAVCLWFVIHIGARFSAPHDLSGTWQFESTSGSFPGGQPSVHSMRIEQSGRYARVSIDEEKAEDVFISREEADSQAGLSVFMRQTAWNLNLRVAPALNALTGTFDGAFDGRFSAHRLPKAHGHEAAARPAVKSGSILHRLLDTPVAIILVQLILVLLVSRVMGILFAKLHQPQVVGEMIAGIMLGPSLLGWVFPTISAAIFPKDPTAMAGLNILSQVGVIFFMFLIGLELDPKLIRNRGHAALVISHVSIIAPFILGAALTLYLYPNVFNHQMPYTSVALFMGASMSITAFPVLARILTERNLHKTSVGAITITCAAIDDVTAWCLLAFVVAVARASGSEASGSWPALMTAGKTVIYVLAMFFLVRPFLQRLQAVHDRQGSLSQNVIAVIFLLTLVSAFTTDAIGIHALFGAFLMGAIMPKGTQFVRTLSDKLEDYTVVFLLPLFFAFTGLRTQIGLLNSVPLWVDTLLIIFVACLGKFGGSTAAARASGFSWRESSAIGILMNTRGLMELIILNIGLELGVITPAVFAMMVIMALVTTGLTTPILQLIRTRALFGDKVPDLKPRKRAPYSILISVADPRSGGPLLRISDLLIGPGGRVVALHLSRPVDRDAYRSGLSDLPAAIADPLRPLLEQAARTNTTVEPLSFATHDIPHAISQVARETQVDMLLMGFHKAVVGRAFLGGTVHRIIAGAPCDVAIFIDRGFVSARRVMVPYLGGRHDRLALDLAGRLARNAGAEITVLHVVAPRRKTEHQLDAQAAVDRVFSDPAQPAPVRVRVVEHTSPVDAVLESGKEFDLVVIGVSEEWGLTSHPFGLRPERIAEGLPVSMLIVRKFSRATGANDATNSAPAKEPESDQLPLQESKITTSPISTG